MPESTAPFTIEGDLDHSTVVLRCRSASKRDREGMAVASAVTAFLTVAAAWYDLGLAVVTYLAIVQFGLVVGFVTTSAHPADITLRLDRTGCRRDGNRVDVAVGRKSVMINGVPHPLRRPLTADEHQQLHAMFRPRDPGTEADIPEPLTTRRRSLEAARQHEHG
jgi:hypothetical protein